MITVVYGPQGSGKTRFAKQLAKHYGCNRIVELEGFDTGYRDPRDGDLVLMQEMPRNNKPGRVRCIAIADALRAAGVHFRPAVRA